ncbi:MAG: hypothetical protein LBG72_08330 [Spirochaetaceae bacterium]|nr:hypothetical protein [Spirochaetaceae bacterium]
MMPVFPPSEQGKRRQIERLMADWKREVAPARVLYRYDGKYYSGAEYFCADGFYPYYFSQKKRILFIAREAVELSGKDFILELLPHYHANEVGGKSVDAYPLHSRLMYLAYGILHDGMIPYNKIPYASEIAATFGTADGISFAFMELSKYSNDNEDASSHCDVELMSSFLRDSHLEKRNFIREELEILEPDIILAMNLSECGLSTALLELALGQFTEIDWRSYTPNATVSAITINGKQTPFIELYHFASRKSTQTAFYDPVMQIITSYPNIY